MAPTIRGRLTVWYTAVLVAALGLFGTWVYVVESRLRVDGLDAELRRTAALVGAAVAAELDEGAALPDAAPEAYKDLATPGRTVAVLDGTGAPLAGGSGDDAGIDFGPLARGDEASATVRRAGGDWRVFVQRQRQGPVSYFIAVAEPLDRLYAQNALLQRTLLVGIPLALALAAAGGWWIARRALHPLSAMVGQARRITDRTPGFRLHVPQPNDEVGLLARAFNDLLERLEGALHTQRRFMADASHELRTPVSITGTAAEVALGRETRSEQEYRDCLGVVAEQSRRLARMVDDMMTLARADAGGLTMEPADLYLDEVLGESTDDAAVLARARQIDLRSESHPETPFRGDERLLRQMLMNLLENGIRHTPPGGRVEARLAVVDGSIEIAVADTGAGVPPAERERIFERFVRLDPARARPGGAGLGLPIARCIAEAHGGTLTLADTGPDGSTFLVRLPRLSS